MLPTDPPIGQVTSFGTQQLREVSGAGTFERDQHLARGVGQAPGDLVRRMHEGLASWRGPVLYT